MIAVRGSIFPYLEIAIALPNLPLSPRIPLALSLNILHHASPRQEFHLDLISETLYKDKITASHSEEVYLQSHAVSPLDESTLQDERKSDTFRLD